MRVDISTIPPALRKPFAAFAEVLLELAGDDLLGLSAFGGAAVADPCFEQAPLRSVAVLRRVDLQMLDRLAARGSRWGRQGVAAPLIMTPEYIEASRDAFPLELLEIQQLERRVCGDEHFADLTFVPADLRLQAERELKSELIQLRQGLLAAAGKHRLLHELCMAAAERSVRVVRGLLHLLGRRAPDAAREVFEVAAEATGLKLVTLARALAAPAPLDFEGFRRCYAEVADLAAHVDALEVGGGAAPAS